MMGFQITPWLIKNKEILIKEMVEGDWHMPFSFPQNKSRRRKLNHELRVAKMRGWRGKVVEP